MNKSRRHTKTGTDLINPRRAAVRVYPKQKPTQSAAREPYKRQNWAAQISLRNRLPQSISKKVKLILENSEKMGTIKASSISRKGVLG
jgi:hypothetical protein